MKLRRVSWLDIAGALIGAPMKTVVTLIICRVRGEWITSGKRTVQSLWKTKIFGFAISLSFNCQCIQQSFCLISCFFNKQSITRSSPNSRDMMTGVLMSFFVTPWVTHHRHMTCLWAYHFTDSWFFAFISVLVEKNHHWTLTWSAFSVAHWVSHRQTFWLWPRHFCCSTCDQDS